MAEKIIGIDLGTTNSVVAVMEGGDPVVIPNAEGGRTTPSVVAFTKDGERLVGTVAKRQAVTNPHNTIFSIKRFMGRRMSEVTEESKRVPYKIGSAGNELASVEISGKKYTPPEISAMILQKLKQTAEDYLGHKVEKAVITVPAYFNDAQRQATKDAGKIAGLEVLRIINEPTAAALAYGFGKDISQKICVYDLGGGTFDVSILEIGKDVFEVLSTAGDTYLGGDDFDDRIMAWLADDFLQKHGLDLRQNKYCLQMLKEAGERAKIEVGRDGVAEILVPGICQSPEGQVLDLKQRLQAEQFNKMVMDLVQRTFKVCDEALQSARLTAHDVDAVILVGGPTRLPIIRSSVRHYFQKDPLTDVDPDEVVALGAAIQGAALLSTTAAEYGQASYLLDVTPLSLRVGTVGGFSEKIIDKNTPIPIEKSKTFTTSRDGQDRVKIRVYQGEASKVEGCELLGEFEFTGFRIGYRGEVQIQVTFEIDSNGIVNVSATDLETGQKASTTISLSSGLSEQDLQRAIDDNAGMELAGHQRAEA